MKLTNVLLCFLCIYTSAFSALTLPIRVMGKVGTIETITLPVENAGEVDKLWMQTHNLAYEGKMSVRVNGGTWINVNHNTANLSEKQMSFGGFGGHANIHKVSLDVTNPEVSEIVNGDNKIDLRFSKGDGVTQGYRVIKINFLDKAGKKLLDDSFFVEEDPTQWKPILNNPADIEAGRKLFQETMLPDLKVVSCSDCHTKNGYDLKYFGYSDFAMMTSAQLHGFTEKQAQQIASFVRSNSAETHGRPWNPPYQPGPQLNGKPIEQWAAGAGIDAVLETDDEMHEHLFPNGTSIKEIKKIVHLDSVLDVTELPIAIPLFEWNRWMQRAHPFQVWPNGEFEKGPYQTYLNLRKTLENNTGNNYIKTGAVIKELDKLQEDTKKWIGEGKSNDLDNWRGLDGINLDARDPKYSREEAKLHLMRWLAVRYFEVMQEFGIEKRAHLYFGTAGNGEGHRQWPMRQRSIFELAPHFLADSIEAFEFNNQPLVVGKLWSSAWYHAQMLLNSGEYGLTKRGSPMDWTYHYTHIWDAQIAGAPKEGYRTVTSIIKMWQERTNGIMGHDGWRWRYMHPMYLWSDELGDESNFEMLNIHDSDLRRKLYSEMLREWMRELRKFPIEDWPRTEVGEKEDWVTLKDVSHTPSDEIDKLGAKFLWAASKQNHCDYLYRLIPRLRKFKIDSYVLNDLIDWCKEAWPKGDWEKWKVTGDSVIESSALQEKLAILTMQSRKLHLTNIAQGSTLHIYDVKGRLILKQAMKAGSFQWQAPSSGMFIVKLHSQEGVQNRSYKVTAM